MVKDKTKPTKKKTKNTKKTKKLHDIFEGQDDCEGCMSYHDFDHRYNHECCYDDDYLHLKSALLANLFVVVLILLFSPIIIAGLVLALIYFVIRDFFNSIKPKKHKEEFHFYGRR